MSKVRAKFECISVQDHPEYENKTVQFQPVIDGSEENKSFSKYTLSGDLCLVISYETPAVNAFEVGKSYYLDITEAQE